MRNPAVVAIIGVRDSGELTIRNIFTLMGASILAGSVVFPLLPPVLAFCIYLVVICICATWLSGTLILLERKRKRAKMLVPLPEIPVLTTEQARTIKEHRTPNAHDSQLERDWLRQWRERFPTAAERLNTSSTRIYDGLPSDARHTVDAIMGQLIGAHRTMPRPDRKGIVERTTRPPPKSALDTSFVTPPALVANLLRDIWEVQTGHYGGRERTGRHWAIMTWNGTILARAATKTAVLDAYAEVYTSGF